MIKTSKKKKKSPEDSSEIKLDNRKGRQVWSAIMSYWPHIQTEIINIDNCKLMTDGVQVVKLHQLPMRNLKNDILSYIHRYASIEKMKLRLQAEKMLKKAQ